MSIATLETSVVPVPRTCSVAEYLELERRSDIRHEYVEGELIPMPGTSLNHNQIAINMTILLDRAFGDRNCTVYMESIRLRVSPTRYRYPDVMALCGDALTDGETPPSLLNPSVIVEVLSASTTEEDQSGKWSEYQQIATLTDYLLIAQERISVIHYVRQNARQWTINEYTEPGETIALAVLDATLTITDIYRKVAFPVSTSVE